MSPASAAIVRPLRRRLVVLGASVALAAAGLAGLAAPGATAAPTSKAPTVPVPPAPVWSTCSGGLGAAGAQCAYVTVPKDYADASAGTIKLAISRVVHTSATYQGVILVNPGGPGGSGLGLSTLGQYVPDHVGDQYDWIGFDPRGVGASIPSVSCMPSFFGYDRPDYVATTPALRQIWLDRSAKYSQACAKKNDPVLLRNLTTRDNALDMDSIRLALGQQQISYYGFSYGTYLGSVYASLFPTHLRRAVFDSTVDPRNVWYAANLTQDVAFQTTTEAFFAWVAEHDDFYHLGSNEAQVSALYYGVLDQLRRHPQNDGKVGPDEWTDAFTAAGYYQLTWLDVADVFEQAVKNGNYAPVTASIEGPTDSDNGFAIYLGTECTDAKSPSSYTRTWEPDANRLNTDYPFLTWSNVWFDAPCLTWPAPPTKPVAVGSSAAPPILLIDETLDAATPYPGSLEVRSLFPGSRLIAVKGGTSHAVTLFGNACTDDAIARYLADGSLPSRGGGGSTGADKVCQPLPEPTPGASTALRANDPRRALLGRV